MTVTEVIEGLKLILEKFGDIPVRKFSYHETGEFEETDVVGICPSYDEENGPPECVMLFDSDEVDTFVEFENPEESESGEREPEVSH